jgi:hypothetical protein
MSEISKLDLDNLHKSQIESTVSIGSKWHYDTQYNDIQHNDTKQKGLKCDTQHKRHSAKMTLSKSDTQHM